MWRIHDLNLKFGQGSVPTYIHMKFQVLVMISDQSFQGSVISRVSALLMSVILKFTHMTVFDKIHRYIPASCPGRPLNN